MLPDSIYMTFNAPTVNEYHRGIFVTTSFKPEDAVSGTLFHAIYTKGAIQCGKESWHFEQRSVSNINTATSLTLAYRIGKLLGTPEEIAAQVRQLEKILSSVKFEAAPERMERLGNVALDGYSCIIWTEDALSALVSEMAPHTFLPSLNFNSDTETITPEGIIAEAALARRLAGPADGSLMVGKHVPGEFAVIN
jgi:hypothetical protein